LQEELAFDDTQVIENIGGRDRGRTGDLIVANDALSQLSYSPTSSIASLAKDTSDSNTRNGAAFWKMMSRSLREINSKS
jgi:hypothetical protein